MPKDLDGALKRLDDVELDTLLVAVNNEAQRRGRQPASRVKPMRQPRPVRAEHGADSLTTGKLNAVRAAFKAGVKPSAIARQFGISQSASERRLPDQVASMSERRAPRMLGENRVLATRINEMLGTVERLLIHDVIGVGKDVGGMMRPRAWAVLKLIS